jgi:hypothetical protein
VAAQRPGESEVFWLLFFKKVTAFFLLQEQTRNNAFKKLKRWRARFGRFGGRLGVILLAGP